MARRIEDAAMADFVAHAGWATEAMRSPGTAVLQATASGAELYRRLGFTEFGVVAEHKTGVP